MTGLDFAGALRRQAVVAAVVAGAALLTTLVITAAQTRVYEATAQLIVAPSAQTVDTSDVIRSVETLERRTVVATFARMASTASVRTAAAQRAGVPSDALIEFETHGSVVPNTNIIRIEATGPDPARVAALANAAALLTAQQAQVLYRVYTLRFLSEAVPAEAPAHPDRKRNALVGLTLALFLGVLAALAADRLRTGEDEPPEWDT